jgi:hypothetical protein
MPSAIEIRWVERMEEGVDCKATWYWWKWLHQVLWRVEAESRWDWKERRLY